MTRYFKDINGETIRYVGIQKGSIWYAENGWIPYDGTESEDRIKIVDGQITILPMQVPDTTAFDEACASFRAICKEIGELISEPDFKGGFDEIAKYQASEQATTTEGIILGLKWNTADKLCTYEASKLGIGQPDWWYRCWETTTTES